jgi:hypothetical protein
VWQDSQYELVMKEALAQADKAYGEALLASFNVSKKYLCENVYPDIARTEPELTRHDASHIENVFKNLGKILPVDEQKKLTVHNQYCLGMAVLFHDVGNIYGRKEHQVKVAEIFDKARAGATYDRRERRIILDAIKAHTGRSYSGDKDTLKDLGDDGEYFHDSEVSLRKVAATLRMADELAEGPQRTSSFVMDCLGYKPKNHLFHLYARCVEVHIDRPRGRFALSHHIPVSRYGQSLVGNGEALKKLLGFMYERVVKLDQERKYTKFYCDWLSPFVSTSASFRFEVDIDDHDLGLPNIELDDKVVPGEYAKGVVERYADYDPDRIVEKLRTIMGEDAAKPAEAEPEDPS